MKAPHVKGIASPSGPESCVGDREVASEALTGENAGQPLSSAGGISYQHKINHNVITMNRLFITIVRLVSL